MAVSTDDIFKQALISFQTGNLNDAERGFKKVLRHQSKHVAALNLLSVVLTRLGRYIEAEHYVKAALKINSSSEATFYNYGLILKALKRPKEALERFSQALSINGAVADTWNNRGTVLNVLKLYNDAIDNFDRAIGLQPRYPEAFYNKGNSLAELKRYDEAFAAYDKALALKPGFGEPWLGRGNVLSKLIRYDEAAAAYDKALALNPYLGEAWLGRGNVFTELKRYDEAFAAYDKALALKSDLGEVWLGRGNVFTELKHFEDAFAAYDKALAINPHLGEVWLGRGNIFNKLKRYDEAVAAYDKALVLRDDLTGLEGLRLHTKMILCDWNDFDTEEVHLIASVRSGAPVTPPFPFLGVSSSSEDQHQCAELWIASKYPSLEKPTWQGERFDNDRIRVAYLSPDFRQHAVSSLLAGMFASHDKSRFDIAAISIGPDDNSAMRQRLRDSFERFIDAQTYSDDQVANLIKELKIDILVDLAGFTTDSRTSVVARRTAPIQANYLGYSGTMGAPYVDYIIADRFVIPEEKRACYSEKVVYLPDSFMGNDSKRKISEHSPRRSECGLPENGFVFCSFNQSYKITPRLFDIWMRLLRQVDSSVLWLSNANETAIRNLKREAQNRGVDPSRIIFAQTVPLDEDHLARHQLADLFLDTLPYNAHTTASDALWAGLPVLTCLGETFAGRVAASLLNAIQLPELITTTPEAYEKMAVDLATHPETLAIIKRKLADNRLTTPLFDTKLFTKHIEAAYVAMVERHQSGLTPDHISIPNS